MRVSLPLLLATFASLFGSQVSAQQAIEPGTEVLANQELKLYSRPPTRVWLIPIVLPAAATNDVVSPGEQFIFRDHQEIYVYPERSLWWQIETADSNESWIYLGPTPYGPAVPGIIDVLPVPAEAAEDEPPSPRLIPGEQATAASKRADEEAEPMNSALEPPPIPMLEPPSVLSGNLIPAVAFAIFLLAYSLGVYLRHQLRPSMQPLRLMPMLGVSVLGLLIVTAGFWFVFQCLAEVVQQSPSMSILGASASATIIVVQQGWYLPEIITRALPLPGSFHLAPNPSSRSPRRRAGGGSARGT